MSFFDVPNLSCRETSSVISLTVLVAITKKILKNPAVLGKIPNDQIFIVDCSIGILGIAVNLCSCKLGKSNNIGPSLLPNATDCHDSRCAYSLLERLKSFIIDFVSMVGN